MLIIKELFMLEAIQLKLEKNYQSLEKKFTQFFILENLQEFIKVLKNLMNALSQTQSAQRQFLNFV